MNTKQRSELRQIAADLLKQRDAINMEGYREMRWLTKQVAAHNESLRLLACRVIDLLDYDTEYKVVRNPNPKPRTVDIGEFTEEIDYRIRY